MPAIIQGGLGLTHASSEKRDSTLYIYIFFNFFFLTTAHHTAQHTLFCIRYLTDGHDWSGVTLTNRLWPI